MCLSLEEVALCHVVVGEGFIPIEHEQQLPVGLTATG